MVRAEAYGGRGPVLMTVGWVESMIGVALCLLRLYGASQKAGHIRWDFFWVAAATFTGIASHACFTVSILHGTGNHVTKLTFGEIFQSLHWIWISIFVGLVAVVFAKFAIIALILEVQGPNARKRRWFLWGLGAAIAVSGIIQICLSLTQCKPIDKLWNPTISGECPTQLVAANWSYFQGAIAVVSDFTLALWPISIVWNLQTTFKVKLGFCALMAGGILPAVASVVRTVLLPTLIESTDITYDFGLFMVWSATELWAVIILGSIPPLRPLFLRFFSKVHTTVTSKSRSALGAYGRGTKAGTNNGTNNGHGVPLQTVSRHGEQSEKKKLYTSAKPVGAMGRSMRDGSEEELARETNGQGIYVSHEYAIETGKRKSSEGGSWFEGQDSL
ncbi:Hypothetical protein D9617_28g065370 [Elsinoe fawcettii]|nr:Hypothetical protein D9617_28g065370 [Elsinoe fawcettii]